LGDGDVADEDGDVTGDDEPAAAEEVAVLPENHK
jgi:hypothetical protein